RLEAAPLERYQKPAAASLKLSRYCTCSDDLTSDTPLTFRAMATALSRSPGDFTTPESVTTPLAVSTSILPTMSGSLRSAVLTRVVMLRSSVAGLLCGAIV